MKHGRLTTLVRVWFIVLAVPAVLVVGNRVARQLSRVWSNSGLWTDLGIPQFWNRETDGPFGIVIRGWRFAKCAEEQWNDYPMDIQNLVIWPQYPRFPGPIYFNATLAVKSALPTEQINLNLETKQLMETQNGQMVWQTIPCHGWDVLTGCDGVGSCKYCDLLDKCRKSVQTGYKHSDDNKVKEFLSEPSKLCPPPIGSWTVSFSKSFDVEEIPKGIFGPLQSNQYWMTFNFVGGNGEKLGCSRIWMDVCKYHLYDPMQKCLRDPNAYRNFVDDITKQTRSG
jgi:ferredoxin